MFWRFLCGSSWSSQSRLHSTFSRINQLNCCIEALKPSHPYSDWFLCVCVSCSGLQYPGSELRVVAFPAVLHLRSALWGKNCFHLLNGFFFNPVLSTFSFSWRPQSDLLQAPAGPWTSGWEALTCPLSLSLQLERSYQRFTAFYASRHSGRKLTWLYHLSKGELVTNCFKNRWVC